jgi:oxalate decarboxylase/phosphoglucose isomerase-like protein (cupin superfamily)
VRVPGRGSRVSTAALATTSEATVAVTAGAEHGIRNTGEGPLRFVYAFATDAVDDVVYRFSDQG